MIDKDKIIKELAHHYEYDTFFLAFHGTMSKEEHHKLFINQLKNLFTEEQAEFIKNCLEGGRAKVINYMPNNLLITREKERLRDDYYQSGKFCMPGGCYRNAIYWG